MFILELGGYYINNSYSMANISYFDLLWKIKYKNIVSMRELDIDSQNMFSITIKNKTELLKLVLPFKHRKKFYLINYT